MSPYSVPVCPWCGMPSRMHPDTHREWMTAHMNCGSEIYPPGATTPSHQSDACKVIASTAADRDALRAELERTKEELEAHRKLENVVRVMIQKKWHEGELSCEEADVDDAFGEINTVRAAHRRKDGA